MVRAFDGATSEVIGDINVELEIKPHVITFLFQIMNIKLAYSMLLGRLWIHLVGSIPFSLYQRIKYVMDRKW